MVLGHHSHRRHSQASSRSSLEEANHDSNPGEDETVVDSEQGNVLSHIISQLRPGADLSRVTLPTFILEPRSMLERITNFMAHPETLLPMPEIDDPVQRFVAVVKFYLSGWHIKPPGVKKPLNPILGEIYTCYWEYPDKTKGYYISEQTSHHPPKSSYFFMAPEHHIRIDGTLKPRSKFLGNSAASMMEGIAVMRFLNRGGERYFVTQPNMYARGILFGKMKYELGDHSYVRCPENGLSADLEFKTKGYFGGTYNAIGGFIKDEKTGQNLYELSGMWNGEMFIKDVVTGQKDLLFDATHARETLPSVRPMDELEERESPKLWSKVIAALRQKDHNTATDEKTRIEDRQREEAAQRASQGVEWQPRLFRRVRGGPGGPEEGEEALDWIISAKIDGKTPQEQIQQILNIAPILPGQTPNSDFAIPPSKKQPVEPTPPAPQPDSAPTHQPSNPTHTQPTPSNPPTEPSPPHQPSNHPQPQPLTQPHPDTHPTTNDNLIDFGPPEPTEYEKRHPAPAVPPSSDILSSSASYPMDAHDGSSDAYPAGLQQPLQPTVQDLTASTITRTDSQTEGKDEFFDAES